MYRSGHFGMALLVYAPVAFGLVLLGAPGLGLVGVVVSIVFARLPDVDQRLPLTHRGPTHTVWFALVTAMGFLDSSLGQPPPQVQVDFSWTASTNQTTISLTGGEQLGTDNTGAFRVVVDHGSHQTGSGATRAKVYMESSTCDNPGYCGSTVTLNGTTVPTKRGVNVLTISPNGTVTTAGRYDVHSGDRWWRSSDPYALGPKQTCGGCAGDKLIEQVDNAAMGDYLLFIGDDQPHTMNNPPHDTVVATLRGLGARFGGHDHLQYRDSWVFVAQKGSGRVLERHALRGRVSGIPWVNATVTISSGQVTVPWATAANTGLEPFPIQAGNQITVGAHPGDTVRVVWVAPNGGRSQTVATFNVPG